MLLAEGHLLIEDVPGVGKTMLAKALARSIDARSAASSSPRTCCPATSPACRVFNQDTREFEFRPGAIFANIVIADEINRASPKTQSALLECMEERQVTVDGHTSHLAAPFMVVATQNPLEMEGTYALPEAQRDRFMVRVSMGYPVEAAEIAMLDSPHAVNPLDDLEPVTDAAEVAQAHRRRRARARLPRGPALRRRAGTATRRSPDLRLGASPRATLHLVRAAKAWAALDGREFVIPDDVRDLAPRARRTGCSPTVEATMSGRRTSEVVQQVLQTVPVPHPRPTRRREACAS